MNTADFSEAFLKANANRSFIADQMADVFGDLMRAISSDDDSGYKAAERMHFVAELLQRCDEPIGLGQIFSDALDVVRTNIPEDRYENDYVHIAKRGLKYLVESSATDNAARGRAAKRLRELQDAIKWQEESRIVSPEAQKTASILRQNAEKLLGKST